MTAGRMRCQAHTLGWAFMCIASVVVLRAAPARASKTTCLTGADPVVATDLAQIAATRLAIETNCQCVDYSKYVYVSNHADYVACAKDQIISAVGLGALRKQCSATVKQYYSVSSCGVPREKAAAPCITTSKSGKVSCAIKPVAKCKIPRRLRTMRAGRRRSVCSRTPSIG